MDVVIEGKITQDEEIADVIQTVIDLKNMPNLVLRVTDEDSDLQGRIAFRGGGYILGARVNNTNECGYDAIRKLLSIKLGNYAILDPGRAVNSDTNQTLWISAERVIDLLPTLPEAPDTLLGIDPESMAARAVAEFSPEVQVQRAEMLKADPRLSNTRINALSPDGADISGEKLTPQLKSKARTYVRSKLYSVELLGIAVLALILGAIVLLYGDVIWQFFRTSLHF